MEKAKKIISYVICVVIAVYVLYNLPFSKDIEKTVTAVIYEDGIAVDKTDVYISGEKSRYIFHDNERFTGTFAMDCYEITGREGVSAGIFWGEDGDYAILHYIQNGSFPDLILDPFMMMSLDMNDFAFRFEDGRVVATSGEMYEKLTYEKIKK